LVPELGAAGAAVALTAARFAGSVGFVMALLPGRHGLPTAFQRMREMPRLASAAVGKRVRSAALVLTPGMLLRPGRDLLGGIFLVGLPAGAESLMFNGGKLLTQTFLAGLGTVAIAADYLASSVAGIAQVPVASLGISLPPLVGSALGSGDPQKAVLRISASVWLGNLGMALVALVAYPLAPLVLAGKAGDVESAALAVRLLRVFVLVSPFLWATSFVVPAGLRGAGDGRYTLAVALGSMWALRVAVGWLLSGPMGLGVRGLWIAMYLDWFARSVFYLNRLHSRRWLPAEKTQPA
jgi:Na+-driven multidrug efflux pump